MVLFRLSIRLPLLFRLPFCREWGLFTNNQTNDSFCRNVIDNTEIVFTNINDCTIVLLNPQIPLAHLVCVVGDGIW